MQKDNTKQSIFCCVPGSCVFYLESGVFDMIWFFSVAGICLLFWCSYANYRQGNAKKDVKSFLMDKAFRDTLIGLISVVLGVTIAINFSDVLEKRENSVKMKELLKLGSKEIITSYKDNESLLAEYLDGSISTEKVKLKAKARTKTLENILINESVMVSLSPTTYVGLSNHIDIVNQLFSEIQDAQNDDREIAVSLAAVDGSFEAIIFLVNNEIQHLEGKLSEKEVYQKYIDYYNETYGELENSESLDLE